MDTIEVLRWQSRRMFDWLEMTLDDVTEEQANWVPTGVANPIGAAYAHLVITADAGFNSQMNGGMPIMATEFGGDVGLSQMPHAAGGWEDWSSLRVDWKRLREYGRAVQRCVESYFESVTVEELEKPVDMRPWNLGMWTALDIYDLHGIHHARIHGGEIACLKGMQGARGWSQQPWRSSVESPVAVQHR